MSNSVSPAGPSARRRKRSGRCTAMSPRSVALLCPPASTVTLCSARIVFHAVDDGSVSTVGARRRMRARRERRTRRAHSGEKKTSLMTRKRVAKPMKVARAIGGVDRLDRHLDERQLHLRRAQQQLRLGVELRRAQLHVEHRAADRRESPTAYRSSARRRSARSTKSRCGCRRGCGAACPRARSCARRRPAPAGSARAPRPAPAISPDRAARRRPWSARRRRRASSRRRSPTPAPRPCRDWPGGAARSRRPPRRRPRSSVDPSSTTTTGSPLARAPRTTSPTVRAPS